MVQFTGFKINTYHDMECNPISKIEFIFLKLFSGNFNNEKLSSNEWFRSDMESKPEAWEWDLSEEKLFIAPWSSIAVGLAAVDENENDQDLLLDAGGMEINLNQYQAEKPTEIHLIKEEADLDLSLFLIWPEEK